MPYLAAYAAIALVFGLLDAVWLTVMGKLVYRPTLGDILLEQLRIAPAIFFYLAFPAGVLIFGTLTGIRSGGVWTAVLFGALFGAFAYATYDLTNFATLRNWTLQITLLDIVYGALLCGIAAAAGYVAYRVAGG
ncbi:DUF2177 family protein [uncultured Nitratireductor sp.]|uniref:DUF2177 family protein n=1 Tax=uncultured Nitratireductor sp. TaxID=520953 RepID=UPI0025E483CB|nr:DUF2177 family protein [uncultured Nitratireductor sp.]